MLEYQVIAHPPVFKIFDLTRAEKKARRDDLSSRERNQVATAEHIGQSPLSRYEDLIARPARSPPPNGGGDYEGLCCAAQQILHAKCRDGSKADIGLAPVDVRFTPKSGHCRPRLECPLCAKSRHRSFHSIIRLAVARSAQDPPVDCKKVPRANRTVGHGGAGQADAVN